MAFKWARSAAFLTFAPLLSSDFYLFDPAP